MPKLTDSAQHRFLGWKETAAEVARLSDAALAALSPADREIVMQALCRIPVTDIGKEPAVKTAISRMLLALDYPAAIQQRDQEIVKAFQTRMDAWMDRLLTSQDETGAVVETMAYMAAEAMGMDLSRLIIAVREESFSENPNSPPTEDFQGLASVFSHHQDDGFIHVVVVLNVENPFWTDHYPMTKWDMQRLGAAMLHEMTHVEQAAKVLADDPGPFYIALKEAYEQVEEFRGIYEIYRSQPNERQCYYRQGCYLDAAQNWVMRDEVDITQLDLRAHQKGAKLSDAVNEFLAKVKAFKPKPD